jgi:hypothetical protein
MSRGAQATALLDESLRATERVLAAAKAGVPFRDVYRAESRGR